MMIKNEAMNLTPALAAGLLLGAMFYGGLWWTVQKGIASKRAWLWFSGSAFLRTGLALSGFYFVAQGDWRKLLSCLLGFVMSRVIVTRFSHAS
jgi:F1F0 ATPase subunit 2